MTPLTPLPILTRETLQVLRYQEKALEKGEVEAVLLSGESAWEEGRVWAGLSLT